MWLFCLIQLLAWQGLITQLRPHQEKFSQVVLMLTLSKNRNGFFGAARDTVGAGSITILATALTGTGSKMEEVILEEFMGTGNSDLYLDREITQKRIFPAIDIERSGTRRDDKLVPSDHLSSSWALRRYLQTMDKSSGIEFLIERLKTIKTIAEFFKAMKR